MTPQINGTLQSLKQEASGFSIDDCRNISVKELKSAVGEMKHEAKGSLKSLAVEQIEENKERVVDAAVGIVEDKAQETIDHVAETIGVDKQMTPLIGGALQSLKQKASELSIDDLRKVSAQKV